MAALMGAMKHGCDGHRNAEWGQLGGGVVAHGGDAAIEVVLGVEARPGHHAGDGMEAGVGEAIEDLRGTAVVMR
jgi:hypothetical protein